MPSAGVEMLPNASGAYRVHAIRCGIQLHLLQKWMGHASMATTAVYANILGEEEWRVARRMWAADTLT